jgi:hypothetical protein
MPSSPSAIAETDLGELVVIADDVELLIHAMPLRRGTARNCLEVKRNERKGVRIYKVR